MTNRFARFVFWAIVVAIILYAIARHDVAQPHSIMSWQTYQRAKAAAQRPTGMTFTFCKWPVCLRS